MVSPFRECAQKLRENGYSVIPLAPKGKHPLIEKWTHYCTRPVDDETFERWLGWKDANIGVCLGVASNLIALDFDYGSTKLHQEILSLIPDSPIKKKGEKGFTAFYAYDGQKSQGFSLDGQRVLDILSHGRQTVLPNSIHPSTQKPYVWLTPKNLEHIPSVGLPHISLNAIQHISNKFIVPPLVVEKKPALVLSDSNENTDEVTQALSYIPADDYEVWISMGMCLKDALGDAGFSLWNAWSQTSDKYDASKMRYQWEAFKGSGRTIASLFQRAMDNGYINIPHVEPIPDFELNGKLTGTNGHHNDVLPESTIVPVLIEPEKKQVSISFPTRLINTAPGLVGQIASYINRTSLILQPTLALACAVATAGTLMGHKVQGHTGLRTNIYTIGLAPSGSGKDHARKICKRMLEDSGVGNFEFGIPASGSGLLSGLRAGGGKGIIYWDEIGRTFKQLTSPRAGNYEKEILTAIMEVFSSSDTIYKGKVYANHDGKNPPKPIIQPCLGIYGTSVPNHFYEALSGNDAIDGFLSRWILFESKNYVLDEDDQDMVFMPTPQEMIDLCKYWKDQPVNADTTGGNLSDTVINPRVVAASEEAAALLKTYSKAMRSKARDLELAGEKTAPVWSRAAEHAYKLALVAHEGDRVEVNVARWAMDASESCCAGMDASIKEHVSSNELEGQTKSVLRYIKSKPDGVSQAEITKAFQGIPMRVRSEIFASLEIRNEITRLTKKNASGLGRTAVAYKAT